LHTFKIIFLILILHFFNLIIFQNKKHTEKRVRLSKIAKQKFKVHPREPIQTRAMTVRNNEIPIIELTAEQGGEGITAVPDQLLEKILATMQDLVTRAAATPPEIQQPQPNVELQQPQPNFEFQQPQQPRPNLEFQQHQSNVEIMQPQHNVEFQQQPAGANLEFRQPRPEEEPKQYQQYYPYFNQYGLGFDAGGHQQDQGQDCLA
jgi:hypothetical protein